MSGEDFSGLDGVFIGDFFIFLVSAIDGSCFNSCSYRYIFGSFTVMAQKHTHVLRVANNYTY